MGIIRKTIVNCLPKKAQSSMGFVRCPYCHEVVDERDYVPHREEHLKLRDDGQHNDYPTLPPWERYQGDISHEPSVYIHTVCGVRTGMPESIIRTYLIDPWYYLANKTYCHGCQTHVWHEECFWVSNGQDLRTWFRRQQLLKPEYRPSNKVLLKLWISETWERLWYRRPKKKMVS